MKEVQIIFHGWSCSKMILFFTKLFTSWGDRKWIKTVSINGLLRTLYPSLLRKKFILICFVWLFAQKFESNASDFVWFFVFPMRKLWINWSFLPSLRFFMRIIIAIARLPLQELCMFWFLFFAKPMTYTSFSELYKLQKHSWPSTSSWNFG